MLSRIGTRSSREIVFSKLPRTEQPLSVSLYPATRRNEIERARRVSPERPSLTVSAASYDGQNRQISAYRVSIHDRFVYACASFYRPYGHRCKARPGLMATLYVNLFDFRTWEVLSEFLSFSWDSRMEAVLLNLLVSDSATIQEVWWIFSSPRVCSKHVLHFLSNCPICISVTGSIACPSPS